MAIKNPKTYARIKQNELRNLANAVGNAAMSKVRHWPASGEGREVKALTENVTRRLSDVHAVSDLRRSLKDLQSSLDDFKKVRMNGFFKSYLADEPFDIGGGRWRPYGAHLNAVIADTERAVAGYVALATKPPAPSEALNAVTPDQQLSPLTFDFTSDVLRVRHHASSVDAVDQRNTDAAREELLDAAPQLIAYLETANFDKKIAQSIVDIDARIQAKQDIIRLGIAAISLQMVVDSAAEEMPSTWSSLLKSYAIGVGMYVSQHNDWIRFSEKSAHANFSDSDVHRLYSAGSQLVRSLREVPEAVDFEVPQSLHYVLETIRDPSRVQKRMVFAAATSIGNVIAVIIRRCSYILGGSLEGAREGFKTATKITVATTLLLLAGKAATHVAPSTGQILQSNWLREAGKMISDGLKSDD